MIRFCRGDGATPDKNRFEMKVFKGFLKLVKLSATCEQTLHCIPPGGVFNVVSCFPAWVRGVRDG